MLTRGQRLWPCRRLLSGPLLSWHVLLPPAGPDPLLSFDSTN